MLGFRGELFYNVLSIVCCHQKVVLIIFILNIESVLLVVTWLLYSRLKSRKSRKSSRFFHSVINRDSLNSPKNKIGKIQNSNPIEFYKVPIPIIWTQYTYEIKDWNISFSRFDFPTVFCLTTIIVKSYWKTIIVILVFNEILFYKSPLAKVLVQVSKQDSTCRPI